MDPAATLDLPQLSGFRKVNFLCLDPSSQKQPFSVADAAGARAGKNDQSAFLSRILQ